MDKKLKRFLAFVVLFIILIVLDRFTKNLAIKYLMDKPAFDIIPGVLELYYLPNGNTGAAFGILKGHQSLFIIICIAVVIVIAFILYNMPFGKKYIFISILLTCIAAGGVGNMIDRAMSSYVVDFIYFSLINFPIFNVADIYVSVSTVLLVIYFIFAIKEEEFKYIESCVKEPFKRNK